MKWHHNPQWNGKFSWINTGFLVLTPLLSAALVPIYLVYEGVSWFQLGIFLFMCAASGFSITAGYHRLFAHQSYETHGVIRFLYLLFGASAFENSAYKWCSDHRYHHRFVDKEGDPYNIHKGFFHAHMGWILRDDPEERSFENARDLAADPLVAWQDRWYMTIAVVVGFGFPTLAGWFFDQAFAGFLFGGLLRIVFVHHGTFFINSAAHYFGSRPYSRKNTARDCWWLAFFTNGEGYHNFHHAFANDYRNGIRWYHWDPSKWWIASLQVLGLSKNLQRTPEPQILRARLESSFEQFRERWNKEVPAPLEAARASLEAKLLDLQVRYREYQTWKEARARDAALEAEWDRAVRNRYRRRRLSQERASIELAMREYHALLRRTLRYGS